MTTNVEFSILKGGFMAFATALAFSGLAQGAETKEPIRIKISAEERQSVDPRLFGQFLERPSWGETGPEAAADKHGNLPPEIVTMLKKMRIPIIRFPGGTDIDYTDWTDMISNAPGRSPERPITKGYKGNDVSNRFGFDEYFRLAAELGWDAILVVNVRDGLAKKKTLSAAAQHAAGLVAYANAPLDAKLPDGMPNWPAIRAKNGHPKPYAVRVFQIGNEWYNFAGDAKNGAGANDPAAIAAWYSKCIVAYADAMRAIDPSIELIMDGWMGNDVENTVFADPEIRRRIKYVTYHKYAPGPMSEAKRDGRQVDPGQLSARDWWLAWSTLPGDFDDQGRNIGLGDRIKFARDLGYEIASTEWNWNGWGMHNGIQQPTEFAYDHAAAIGVAGFLNGMIRQSDAIRIANQSMLVGHSWGIAAIHYDPAGKVPTYFNAQGMVTTFYNLHHGTRVLDVEVSGVPIIERPYYYDWGGAQPGKLALLDVVVTRHERAIFVHAVNHSFDEDLTAEIDLTAVGSKDGRATMHILECVPAEKMPAARAWMKETSQPVKVTAGKVRLAFPSRTVAILEVPVK
jgi:alpha-N-arabinofuranosidase